MKSMLIKSVFTLGVVSYMCLWGSYVSAAEQQSTEKKSSVIKKKKIFSRNDAEKYKEHNKVIIPDGYTEIEEGTFRDFVNLVSVEISGSIKTIGKYAFEGCENLSAVKLAGGVEQIGVGAFATCKKLKSIHLPSSIKVIDDYAFMECEALTYVQLPKKLELLGKGAFESCRNLISVDLLSGKRLTKIGDMAFYGANLLENIFIGYDIKANTGDRLFEGCNVTTIRVSTNVKEISAGMFSSCKAVKSIIGPKCIIDQCSKLFSEEVNSTISKHVIDDEDITPTVPLVFSSDDRKMSRKILDKNGAVIGMEIPAGYTSIASDAFGTNDKKRFKKIVIPHSVIEIKTGAFSGFGSLEEAKLPDHFMKIDRAALFPDSKSVKIEETPHNVKRNISRDEVQTPNVSIEDLTSQASEQYAILEGEVIAEAELPQPETYTIESVTLEEPKHTSVEVDLNRPFIDKNIRLELTQGNGWVKAVIPDGYESVKSNVFAKGAHRFQTVYIPDSVSEIEREAFSECSALKQLDIPSSVQYIGESAFSGCTNLEDIKIPRGVEMIPNWAFLTCSKLNSVVLPDTVASIGTGAFHSCYSLKNLTIPSSVQSIGFEAFKNCEALESIEIPYRFTVAGSAALAEAKKLQKVTITPCGEVSSAFASCKGLKEVSIQSGVKIIGDYMFKNCGSLETITIPASLEWISHTAFKGCTSLKKINIEGEGAKSVKVDSSGSIETNSGTLVDFFKERGYSNIKKSIGFSLAQKKLRKKNRF